MGEKRNIIPGNKRCEICGVRELDVENSVDSMIFCSKNLRDRKIFSNFAAGNVKSELSIRAGNVQNTQV